MNAFFQLERTDDGVYLKLFSPTNGGKQIDTRELADYLDRNKIEYDKGTLVTNCIGLRENKIIKISGQTIKPVNESVNVYVNEDKTLAIGRFYPPSNGGSQMTREEIINDLVRVNVRYGAKEDVIAAFLSKRTYCTDIILAQATPPVDGKSAVITYHFNIDLNRKPKTNEDGSVDFHQLENISLVEKGELLATLEPAVQGKPGIDICGNPIQPHKVVNKVLRYGRNIHLSEDNCKMYSDVSGHVMLIDDKVFVEGTYEVAADVDASTGDINYSGSVHVKGSVRTGYQIVAKGDIIVEEAVEGATLTAGGQIILKRGIQGMNKGTLNAEGNVITKFIENATVNCGGYVATDSILHSKVTAKGDILVNGRKGFITGGQIRSGTMISAKTAGSGMGTTTLLEVGTDPTLLEEFHALEKEIAELEDEIEKITQILTMFAKKIRSGEKLPTDKVIYIRTLSSTKEKHQQRINEIDHRMMNLQEIIENNTNGCVKISSMIYPGCKVVISNVVYFVRSELAHCTLMKDGADIKVGPL